MTEAIEGGCRCGQLRYRLRLAQLPKVYACHCRACQTRSGSAFSLNFFLPDALLEVTGRTTPYERTAAGETSQEHACPICFAHIFEADSPAPGLVMMCAGTLDRSDELDIAAHIWTRRKLAGIALAPGVPAWPERPPVAEFVARMTAS
jgi:hypothetical protein